jgi:hypothetical protein
MKLFKNYMGDDKGESSIRLALIWSLLLSTACFFAMLFYIIYNTLENRPIEWYGLATFAGGVSSFFLAAVYGKVTQKKYEIDYSQPQMPYQPPFDPGMVGQLMNTDSSMKG